MYGTFISRADTRLGADWLGSTDPRVFATRPIALYPPDSDRLPTAKTSRMAEVIQLPEEVVSLVATHDEESIADDVGAVVVLIVLAASQHPALLVGPFGSLAAARTWLGRVDGSGSGHRAECYVLTLRHSDLGVDAAADEGSLPQATSVVLLDTEDASVVYGPFGSGMDAALYRHDVTGVLTLTNVRQVHICKLASPADAVEPARDGEKVSTNDRVRGWVVRLTPIGHAKPRPVGPFNAEDSARTWCAASGSTAATALPIYAPRRHVGQPYCWSLARARQPRRPMSVNHRDRYTVLVYRRHSS